MPTKIVVAVLVVVAVAAGGFYLTRAPSVPSTAVTADVGAAVATTPTTESEIVATPEPEVTAPVATSSPETAVNAPVAAPTAALREITVTGGNFAFSVKSLTLKKGQKVRLTFVNTEGMHDFKLDEFGVATKRLKTGESETVEFTPDKTGTFEAYCSVGAHRAMGMVTAVTVE